MNSFLKINKSILISILILLVSIFLISLIFKKTNLANISEDALLDVDPKFDISNPSFTINNDKEKISVKAKKGNFLTKDLVLLKKNVQFESPNFKLFSDEVTFDKNDPTAKSDKDSKFESEGVEIFSQGFSIENNGDLIIFNGKTLFISKK